MWALAVNIYLFSSNYDYDAIFCFSDWHFIYCIMADSIMSKAATMEIPINSNGDTGTPEDDSLEQVSGLFSHWDGCIFSVKACHVIFMWQHNLR